MSTTPLPILYSFRRCPYAMRARMAIYVASISVEHIEVSLKNKPQSLLDYSSKGTVPVIVTPSGEVIEHSRDIMLWALAQADPDDWLYKNNHIKQQEMAALIDRCDDEFKPFLDRYKYFERYPETTQLEYRQQSEIFVQALEEKLSRHVFLFDENMRFADIAIFPFIRQFSGVDKTWFEESPYRNLQRWLNTCISTTLFAAIMESKS